ncbi:MAG: YcxB family protein [Anaerolineaceae bacterium]|nr:YcxB family protein [Anaerolineaceae bacterium]
MEKTPIQNEAREPLESIVENSESVQQKGLEPANGKNFLVKTGSTKEDYLDALKHINKINWMTWATMGMFIVIMAVVLLMSMSGAASQSSTNTLWSVGLILVALFMLINGLFINPQRLAGKLASDPIVSAPGTLVIDDSGMLDSKSATGKPIPWTIFKDMFETNRSYLLMSAANRGAYQVLPKRNFADPQEAEAFRQFALTKLPKASLRKTPLQIFPLIMFLLSFGMLLWVLFARLK